MSFLIFILLCFQIPSTAQDDPAYNEIPVGVILDMESWVGKTIHSCITMALSDFYTVNSRYKTRIVLHNRDTHGEPFHALSAALELLEKPKVQAIIGSESTTEAKFLAVLGDEARVPILSFSPTPISNNNMHPYFLQITQEETTQFKAIAAIIESFKWKKVILICEDTGNEIELAMIITNAFQEKSIVITYTSLISTSASNELIQEELHKLSAMQTRIYVLHSSHVFASHLFLNAKYLGMMDAGYKWIVTSKTTNFLSFMNDEVMTSIHGLVGLKSYIPKSRDLHKLTLKWRKKFHTRNSEIELKEINAYGIWAYDAVSALAMAVERIQSVEEVFKLSIDLEATGLTRRGTALLNQMLRISFHGLGGCFQLTNGSLTAEVMEIINVIDKGEHRVGFWRIDSAFTRETGNVNSYSDDGLKATIWPGGIMTNPAHRMLQMSSKTIRVGIVIGIRLQGLFQTNYDVQTGSIVVSGFCAEVFSKAFAALGPNIAFEYTPFMGEHYNDLVYRVYLGEFDAAIGDITITANRSLYVDFTHPYTDLGLATLSRNADASMWIFLKPLSTDLWAASVCFFILLGFVIWILEHRVNQEFQGSTAQQIGKTFWFAFSTLVYAQRQKLQSNLSRFVVSVWMFVVLVLTSCYIATLSSLLTVEQIRLASKGDSIGYHTGSFTRGVILENLNFKDSTLRPLDTPEDYADALSRGSKNGGVDAIVDEIPYIKLFLGQYPSGYSSTMSKVTTNGFGFAFRKGSDLVPKMSTQIARLREDGTIKMLEDKWFNQNSNMMSKDSVPGPKVLNFKGLRGLFLIGGVSMAVALFIFVIYYVHEKMNFIYTMFAGGKLLFILRLLVATSANTVEEPK